uniref:Protein S100 n=1 Tax=Acanthochromis polyacanthus TaxID=80966 RepID=A0A3Q1H3K0_9TELE
MEPKCSRLDMCVGLLIDTFCNFSGTDDDSSTLSKGELKTLLQKELPFTLDHATDKARLDEVFATLDGDKDGVINFEEFVSMVGAVAALCHEHFSEMRKQAECQMPAL